MNNTVKKAVLINGSPKTSEASVSAALAGILEQQLSSAGICVTDIGIRKNISRDNDKDFLSMMEADALVFLFPLYFFCLPGILIRYLQDFFDFYVRHKDEAAGEPKIYTVVNCGFKESDINTEALRVIKSFSSHINASYRFGVALGGGGMFLGAQGAPFMKKPMQALNAAFSGIADDISVSKPPEGDVYIEIKFPRALYFLGGNLGWGQLSRKNGLKKKDLYRQPYKA
jgi:hypothetical protein